jgi:hypothetical protein
VIKAILIWIIGSSCLSLLARLPPTGRRVRIKLTSIRVDDQDKALSVRDGQGAPNYSSWRRITGSIRVAPRPDAAGAQRHEGDASCRAHDHERIGARHANEATASVIPTGTGHARHLADAAG